MFTKNNKTVRALRDHLGDLHTDYKIILKWIIKNIVFAMHSSGSGTGYVASSSEHGNKTLSFIKYGKFLDEINDYQLLIKDSAS
jgi:hypothetical protein